MADKLSEDQIRWARRIEQAAEKPIELINLLRKPALEYDRQDLAGPSILEVDLNLEGADLNRNGLGDCKVCRKYRRVWGSVCAWCGADPEDFEQE